ncbi:MAG: hypothetical protein OEV40_26880 [Acidimicrobiia bacterium]|nr:hypothetical protein [Acidimicrobiia bacterium]
MITFKCLLNGAIDDAARNRVVDGLARIHGEHFGVDPGEVTVEFTEVATGRWYTGGELSSASMVLGTVPAGTPQDVRERVMDEIARCFSAVTDTDYHDVMVVAADPRA